MNLYLIGVLAALAVFFAVGIFAGRKVRSTNDYYVAGRKAPVILIVGSLIASFLSTGAFLGDTGEVYSGLFIGIVTVGILQATGYIYGACLFGRYIRRVEVNTLPEYFGRRFNSPAVRRLAAIILIVSVSAYLLSAIQGVASVMNSVSGLPYPVCTIITWLAFTVFTIYSGSPGVLITDTIMFLVFLVAAMLALPFIVAASGGWSEGIAALAVSTDMPGIISWAGNPDYLYPDGVSNTVWAITYGIVWALVVSVSPWQTSRYLMAKDEHVVVRSSIWSSIGVMTVTVSLYFMAAFIRNINPDLKGSFALIWAAMNVLPPLIGIILLAGITAAGISSASTFLSLIGFSVTNDILPTKYADDRTKLRISRISMLVASLVILVPAYLNPPQIFIIMYFGGTVIASSWSLAAFGSVWSKKLSKTGVFCGMLAGFIGCAATKAGFALAGFTPPMYLDPFFIGIVCSVIFAVLGSKLRPVSELEIQRREELFNAADDADEKENERDRRLWVVYLVFGVFAALFFLFAYALPYVRAV